MYVQLVESYRNDKGTPTHRVVAHLGRCSELLFENLKKAFAAERNGQAVVVQGDFERETEVEVAVQKNLIYVPVAVVDHFFGSIGLHDIVEQLCPPRRRTVSSAAVLSALVAHRCIDPGSKLAFQKWLEHVAVEPIFNCSAARLNNTRVHRCLDDLARVDEGLQEHLAQRITTRQGPARVLYLDLTDTWFEAGGGSLARKGETKAGHRCKRKISIALMVNEDGLPMRWQLLPGTLNETTVLPQWLPELQGKERYRDAVLVFDRGLPSVDNFHRLLEPVGGHRFLTSIKSDAIPTYIRLEERALDALQGLDDDAPRAEVAAACAQLGLQASVLGLDTFRADLGVVEPPEPNSRSKRRPPAMRLYLYFNADIRRTKRRLRQERLEAAQQFVAELNARLAEAKRSRKPEPIVASVTERLRKLQLLEAHDIDLQPLQLPGKTKAIRSFKVQLHLKGRVLRNMSRFDGLALLAGHPNLQLSCDEAIAVYRQKNAVEADFRTIKAVLDLRPTFHWTDAHIRAHVTLCVLALLVERLMELKLASHRPLKSASAALADLAGCSLHRIRVNSTTQWCLTESAHDPNKPRNQSGHDPELLKLLHVLGVRRLLDRFSTTVSLPVKARRT